MMPIMLKSKILGTVSMAAGVQTSSVEQLWAEGGGGGGGGG